MKLLLSLCLAFYLVPCFSQQTGERLPINTSFRLVAKNNKHIYTYRNGNLLKVFLHDGDKITQVKGRLFVYDESHIQIMPFGKNEIVTINVNDIAKIAKWKRRGKISSAIIGGTGIITLVLAASMTTASRPGVAEGNLLAFSLVLYSIGVLWYEVIAIPYIYISEAISVRSESKGYHFFIAQATSGGYK